MAIRPAPRSLDALCVELAEVAPRLRGDGRVEVRDVRLDSRRVEPGDLFVARLGTRVDGARFVREAVRRGAVAILADEGAALGELAVPVLSVRDVDRAAGLAAELVWGWPSRALDVVGITGTNGKTTVAWLTARALEVTGTPTARLGTLGYSCGDDVDPETLTTPGPDDVSRYLARARDAGAKRFIMEVSSHALAQRRVDALSFAVAAFTNLTQDHLDYHGSMGAYGASKARLFDELAPSAAVINVDDELGAALAARSRAPRCLRVGRDAGADIRPTDVTVDRRGIRGQLATPGGPATLDSRLVGRHNLYNLMVALGVGLALGVDAEAMARALSAVPGVPGRLERCDDAGDDVVVLVDYAHTPDALARVLEAARALTRQRLLCVFGCGGDRDPDKRAKMGAAVGAGADWAVVTNDNPRSEDPRRIGESIEVGLRPSGTPYEVILDRAEAIRRAIVEAAPGDVVLVAGKGHEPYQIVGSERREFDDRLEARRALAVRRGAS